MPEKKGAGSKAAGSSKQGSALKAEQNGSKRKKQAPVAAAAESADEDGADDDSDVVSDTDGDTSGTESDDLDLAKVGEDDSDEDDDESDDEDAEDDADANVVNVEFNFKDASDIDYKSINRLLAHYLPGEEETFDVGAFTDAIIAQRVLGTMVHVNDDLDVYAFATVLPIAKHKDAPWMKDIINYIIRKGKDEAVKGKLRAMVDSPNSSGLGLLVNERVLNMPPELAPALLDNLLKDIEWAKEKAIESERQLYDFKHFLFVSPCWLEKATPDAVHARQQAVADAKQIAKMMSGAASHASSSKQHKHASAAASSSSSSSASDNIDPTSGQLINYYHFEEELLVSEALESSSPSTAGAAAASSSSSSSAAAFSFTFHVASTSNVDTGAVSGGAGAGAGSKRKGAANDDDEDAGAQKSLRAPQARRVTVLPVAALARAAEASKHMLNLVESSLGGSSMVAAAPAASSASAGAAASNKAAKPSSAAAGGQSQAKSSGGKASGASSSKVQFAQVEKSVGTAGKNKKAKK